MAVKNISVPSLEQPNKHLQLESCKMGEVASSKERKKN